MVDPRVEADFNRLVGHWFKLIRADAYVGDTDDQRVIIFDPPVAFTLQGDPGPFSIADAILPPVPAPLNTAPMRDMLGHTNDDWLDPIYDVVPVDPKDPQVAKYRSFSCYGKSYNVKTGEVQDGDVRSLRFKDGGWALYT